MDHAIQLKAEEICEHVIMVYKGRKVLDEDLAAIRRQYDPRAILFDPLVPGAASRTLGTLPEVERVHEKEGSFEILLREGTEPVSAMRRIMDTVPGARIELSRPRLEDVFVQLVADGASGDDEDQLRAELQSADAEGTMA